MANLQTYMHPGVVQCTTLLRRNKSAHLRQGELTSSCGPLAILMAMIVLGVASKPYVRRLHDVSQGDLLEPLWSKARELFFAGADHPSMLVLLDTVARYVQRQAETGSMRNILRFTLKRLSENDVVVLGFGDLRAPGPCHWALAVGTESKVAGNRRAVTAILCLDSAEATPTLAPYNARLDIASPRRGGKHLHYRGPDGRVLLMTCTSGIALSRRK